MAFFVSVANTGLILYVWHRKRLMGAFFVCVQARDLADFREEIGVRSEGLGEERRAVNMGYFSIKTIES